MTFNPKFTAIVGFIAFAGMTGQAQAECSGPPLSIPGYSAAIEGALTVKAGTGCAFGVDGIEGAISEVKITQMPKSGRAGVQNLRAIYVAKPGYQGPDEFTYAFIGTDNRGGPMHIAIKRKVTVVP
ncbi:hypothetical protein MHY87_11590 [Microvirga sp. ACRRW]|uniref:hypothetical protein n=1 Tax=Microvirga sp. ACRRW TaxID=2918205 RepID=UPI001EF4B903|nr:hypothetical protein [Microvirga sp. ACRRW]MCG7393549.1 hypothetical protein [Microvirga sp. ACRRW]